MPAADENDVILGPLLRRVDGDRATIWIETSRPGTVEVQAGDTSATARTFTAHGHHYGYVCVAGLPPDSMTPYQVLLDGEPVWPPPDYPYPAPVIRTRPADAPVRILFGSCRESSPLHTSRFLPPDALDAYAVRLSERVARAGHDPADWPDLIMLLGDQVYADKTTSKMREFLKRRRRGGASDAPLSQVVEYDEYTRLYVESWADPDIRWLLSTVPSTMIFDDHEIIDDWNISASWRVDIAREPWWARRIVSGLSSYWVYQHLGNIAPDDLADDPVFKAVTSRDDATEFLDGFGARADQDSTAYRWSYALDVGRTRVVVLDSRAGRQLEPGKRAMLAPADWAWLEEQVTGDFDHVVIGSSLPWLMPPAVHHVEAANERLCESRRRPVARLAERLRRRVDLEHWAAFGASFTALTELLTRVADREGGPATVSVLSGDVHHSYVARADLPTRSPVYQLTCSPVHNELPAFMRPSMRFAWSRTAALIGRGIARAAGLPPPPMRWHRLAGPVYENAITELTHTGRGAQVWIEATDSDKQLQDAGSVTLA